MWEVTDTVIMWAIMNNGMGTGECSRPKAKSPRVPRCWVCISRVWSILDVATRYMEPALEWPTEITESLQLFCYMIVLYVEPIWRNGKAFDSGLRGPGPRSQEMSAHSYALHSVCPLLSFLTTIVWRF